jgi:hypothetical protein
MHIAKVQDCLWNMYMYDVHFVCRFNNKLLYLHNIFQYIVSIVSTGAVMVNDRMVVGHGFTTTCTISAYYHWSCEFESWCVLDPTLFDKVCQWLVSGWWFSLGTPVSSNNKTDHHDITEILLKVALNTITLTQFQYIIDLVYPHSFGIVMFNIQ